MYLSLIFCINADFSKICQTSVLTNNVLPRSNNKRGYFYVQLWNAKYPNYQAYQKTRSSRFYSDSLFMVDQTEI